MLSSEKLQASWNTARRNRGECCCNSNSDGGAEKKKSLDGAAILLLWTELLLLDSRQKEVIWDTIDAVLKAVGMPMSLCSSIINRDNGWCNTKAVIVDHKEEPHKTDVVMFWAVKKYCCITLFIKNSFLCTHSLSSLLCYFWILLQPCLVKLLANFWCYMSVTVTPMKYCLPEIIMGFGGVNQILNAN